MVFYTTDGNASQGEVMRLTADNLVGIGTATPAATLTVNGGSSSSVLDIQGRTSDDYGIISFRTNDGATLKGNIQCNADDDMIFRTGPSTNRMTIDSSGNVKIGSGDDRTSTLTATSANLQVDGGIVFEPGSGNDAEIYNYRGTSLKFGTSGNERMRIDSSGNVGIGTTSPEYANDQHNALHVLTVGGSSANNYGSIEIAGDETTDNDTVGFLKFVNSNNSDSSAATDANLGGLRMLIETSDANAGDDSGGHLLFLTKPEAGAVAERMRIDSAGNVGIGDVDPDSRLHITDANGNAPLVTCELTGGGGKLISFITNGYENGYIQEAAGTVSLVAFTGAHASQTSDENTNITVGTVLSTIDEEFKPHHPKSKISDVESDTRVYGVLQNYEEGESSFVVASVGIGSVRVTGSCSGGDLLVSNGDGTAKVDNNATLQTCIGKVTIGNSTVSVKLVSCVLYCG
jgi:hypothetical protein